MDKDRYWSTNRYYWKRKRKKYDGWFFNERKFIEEEIGISEKVQVRICRKLEKQKLIWIKKHGVPQRNIL